VEEGVRHLANVVLHKGKDYIISSATFPSYFLKNDEEAASTHISLDLKIFSQYIAPLLNIQKRYIGQEPSCVLTRRYNTIMKKLLPSVGIDVEEIPRLLWEGDAISASAVREYIRLGQMDKVKQLVPDTTYQFLLSVEAGEIIRRIREMS
jgi:[citrate (pro-3S)-lyase] ligase